MIAELKACYPGVRKGKVATYGGDQRSLSSKTWQHCGCGLVAAFDLVRYLQLHHTGFQTSLFTGIPSESQLPLPLYELCLRRMSHFVQILPLIGSSGFALALGLNGYFRHYGLPLRASWSVSRDQLWPEVRKMLEQDLPVILSVGKKLRHFNGERGVALYQRSGEELLQTGKCVYAHFVTVTGVDEHWLKIASWGKEFFMRKADFCRYCDTHSTNLLCTIVQLRPLAE